MRRRTLAGAAVASLAASAPAFAQAATTKEQIIGSWKVVSLKTTSEGKVSHPLGERPAGFVGITPDRFWLIFVDSTRRPPASPALTDAEAVALMKSQVAWSGTYTIGEQTADGLKLTAHVEVSSSQSITGMDRVYFVNAEGDKLTFKSPGVVVPMTGAMSVVEFEMIRV